MRNESIFKLQSTKAKKICQKLFNFTLLEHCYCKSERRVYSNTILFYTTFCSFLTLLLIVLSIPVSCHFAFAQDGATTQNGQQPLNSQGVATAGALLEKVSDKGNYRIQIMWNESSLALSKKGFDMEIDFLNASAPLANGKYSSTKGIKCKGRIKYWCKQTQCSF